ncbi:hypothetical protein SLA_6830 [Streptomyces laurentii]|uniref:Uncharacterized protein n=1 Tax=Streptomyces laurentii TaxID=39478 RepID=A0A160P8M2_STRLU|nr:hypothetical protein SLA_6830 [Streptomyces laurentii]
MNAGLPDGWTIERLRSVSGDPEAAVLSPDRRVVVEDHGGVGGHTPLRPEIVLSFHELCLVRADDEWYMGQLGADGSIVCWASYGCALEEALRGL